ncbi:TPA: hypothetical protein ACSP1Y_004710 [Aeromonas hydrophila]
MTMLLINSMSISVINLLACLCGEANKGGSVSFSSFKTIEHSKVIASVSAYLRMLSTESTLLRVNVLPFGVSIVVDTAPIVYKSVGSVEKWGWPAKKQLAVVVPAWGEGNIVNYFWTDGSYSDFNTRTRKFIRHHADVSHFYKWGWPVGKQLSTVVNAWGTPKYVNYFWTDGSYSDFSIRERKFTRHYSDTNHFTSGWPASRRRASQEVIGDSVYHPSASP